DPALTTRLPGGRRGHDPLRVVLDAGLRTPPTAKVAGPGTLIATLPGAPRRREEALRRRGADVVRLPAAPGEPDLVDLGAVLDELGRRAVLELLVEGGA